MAKIVNGSSAREVVAVMLGAVAMCLTGIVTAGSAAADDPKPCPLLAPKVWNNGSVDRFEGDAYDEKGHLHHGSVEVGPDKKGVPITVVMAPYQTDDRPLPGLGPNGQLHIQTTAKDLFSKESFPADIYFRAVTCTQDTNNKYFVETMELYMAIRKPDATETLQSRANAPLKLA